MGVGEMSQDAFTGFLTDALSWRTLRDIDRAGDPPRFIINDDDFDEGVELSVYGEGLQRMFHIGLLFAGAKNGIVLIDELENAIHASLLQPFARFIADLARELNVQVFLTTHSRECIQAFVEPELAEDVAYYALQRERARTRCERLDGERLAKLFTLMDIEPRRLS
jgi:AAA15 family ATPase/GTPase